MRSQIKDISGLEHHARHVWRMCPLIALAAGSRTSPVSITAQSVSLERIHFHRGQGELSQLAGLEACGLMGRLVGSCLCVYCGRERSAWNWLLTDVVRMCAADFALDTLR